MLKKLFILILLIGFNLNAQLVITKPTLVGFNKVCASASFNNYNLKFTFVGSLQPGNQFSVELSDANGGFSNPITVNTFSATTSPVNTSFSVPSTVYGENYKVRIKSTNPGTLSPASDTFAAFYAIYNQTFTINGNQSTLRLCNNAPSVLSIDPGSNSPLQYPQLNYRWKKDGSEISGENESSLDVNQAGVYSTEINYGSCSGYFDVHSNQVTVSNLVLLPTIQTSDQSNTICEGTPKQIICSIQGANYSYKWYKDGVLILGANSYVYGANLPGKYKVTVTESGCDFSSNELTLTSNPISATIIPPVTNVLIPGQQIILVSVTDAVQPSYKWYKDGNEILGQTSATLLITKNGTYKVLVKQNQGCQAEQAAETKIIYPTGFDLGIQNTSVYYQCQSTSANLAINKFNALTPSGPVNILGNNYNYGYQWYKDGGAISGQTGITLSLNNSQANGTYKLGVTIPDFGEIFSNNLDVQLKIIEDISISASAAFCKNGDTVILQSKLTNPNYVYDWYFNGAKVATNNSGNYTITQAGSYYLIVRSGSCSLQSNTVNVQAANFNLSLTAPSTVIIPGQQMILTVTNDAQQPTYVWFKDNVEILGENSNTLTISKNGNYKVVVKQNQGCTVEKSAEILIQYPTGFEIVIKNAQPYVQCQNTSASLVIEKFNALTPSGPVSILGNDSGFVYQWQKNGIDVPDAVSTTLNLANALDNGSYKLGVTIPEFGVTFSNSNDVQLKITEDIAISVNGLFCKNGDSVVLQSKLTNLKYTYEWYFNGTKVSANVGSYTVSQAGNYYLLVKSGSCSLQSNVITLKEAVYSVNISSEKTFIIPGQVLTLNVNTDAVQPVYVWYKDGNPIDGANASVIQINEPGVYKVKVTQTQGCQVEKSAEIAIGYPSGFTVTIATEAGYEECKTLNTNLKLVKIIANSISGNVDISDNPYGYTFQWYKDNLEVNGAMNSTFSVTDFAQNGDYKLKVNIPDFPNVFSNSLNVLLGLSQPVTITQNGVFCDEGSEVTLTSNYTDQSYVYEWFESSGSTVLGNQNEITVTHSGDYYLKVSQYGCSLSSNVISIRPYGFSEISIDAPEKFAITEGEYRIITATGADSYQWYYDNQLVSTSNSYKVEKAGTYTLIVKVGECQKAYTFEVSYHEKKYIVSNTVTPNGDGFNDYWSIPLEYAYKQDVLVTIFDSNGNIVLRTTAYENNWPLGNFQFSSQSPVFYFTVEKIGGGVLKEGAITIIK